MTFLTIMPDVNQVVLTIIVSAGVSMLMTGIYWFGKIIYLKWQKGRTFKEYKKYAIEFLERYLKTLKTKDIAYYDETHKLDDLSFNFVIAEGNQSEKIKDSEIPTVIFGVLAEEKYLTTSEKNLLNTVLAYMSEKDKWLVGRKKIDSEKKMVDFSILFLFQRGKTLFELNSNCYIGSIVSEDKISEILTKLKHGEFDKRIKKIIKSCKLD